MAFIHKTYCEDCGAEVQDIFKHGPEVCPESPENAAKRKAEHAVWEKEYNRVSDAWNAWQDEQGNLEHAYPSVPKTPDEIAFEGKCVLVYETDYPGEEDYANFESPVLENPTWGDIARQFDQAIPMVGDFHHSFLEGLYKQRDDGDVSVFKFCTGS
jgi:hypothetical protein